MVWWEIVVFGLWFLVFVCVWVFCCVVVCVGVLGGGDVFDVEVLLGVCDC